MYVVLYQQYVFFYKQKTAYEMRISDWSSDVCSSDLWLPGSPTDELISDAHLSPDVREFKIVVPATSGTWGITGEVLVLSRTPTIALDDRMTCQVSLQFSGGRDEAATVTP